MPLKNGSDSVFELLRKAREDKSGDAEFSEEDIKYRAILATLLRLKRKERVPPSRANKLFDYDQITEQRAPKSRGSKIEPDVPPEYPYTCKPDCETCFTQFFPVRLAVSDAEALSGVQTLTNRINADLAYLRCVLKRHADLLVTRWKKKSKAKRTEFLSRLAPEEKARGILDHDPSAVQLYNKKWAAVYMIDDHSRTDSHNPDPEKFFGGSEYANNKVAHALLPHMQNCIEHVLLEAVKERTRTSWLLPYLDIESLAEDPLLLLSLLHYRTAYDPEDWMMFDNLQLKLAENWETLITEFNRHCVNMRGAQYGSELVEWDKECAHHWDVVGYQKAQYILSAQQQMMNFLRRVVHRLLEETHAFNNDLADKGNVSASARSRDGKTPIEDRVTTQLKNTHLSDATKEGDFNEQTKSPKWDQLVQNKFFSFGSSSAQSVRASANQPFSAPPEFDPVKTLELVESLYHASVDELDLAQTDPAYLQYLVRELGATAYFERLDSESRWDWYMDEIVCNFYRRFIWWRQMLKECRRMLELYETDLETPSVKNRTEYEHAVFSIHDASIEHMAQQIRLLDYSLHFQRGFEGNFEWGRETFPDGTKRPIVGEKDAFEHDKLFWSLKGLGFDEYRMFTMDPSFHFRVLDDHLSHANFKERSRISEQLLRQVSEIAVVDEIRTAIECDRNWDRQPDQLEHPQFRKDFISKYQKELSLPEIIDKSRVSKRLRTFCKDTPWPKGKIDNTWLENATASRKHLEQLWLCFRTALKAQQQQKGFSQEFIDEDWDALSATDKPEYAHAIEEEQRLIRETISQQALAYNEKRMKSTFFPLPAANGDKPEKFVPLAVRDKKKTRSSQTDSDGGPTSLDTASTPSETTASPDMTENQPCISRISVKAENLSLFAAMFSTDKERTRSFSWKHFLQAMVDAGFSVTQGSGSAVSFKNERGVIVFHQPHPEPTIEPVVLLSMGKRLRKWFRWDKDVFATKTAA